MRRLNRQRIDFESRDLKRMPSRSSSEQQTNDHQAFNAWETMAKEEDATGQNFTWNEDRFLKDPQYRQSREEHGWDQAKCEEMNKLAQEDHSYTLTRSELLRYSSNWSLQLNSSGRNAPMATRSDYRSAVALKVISTENLKNIKNQSHHTSSRPSARRHEVLRIMPPRSSSNQENWVAILDNFFFNLVADW